MSKQCPEPSDGYRSQYANINKIDFKRAWELAVELDPSLPKQPTEPVSDEMRRAIVSFARKTEEALYEWS